MATARLTDEQLREAVALKKQYGTNIAAAEACVPPVTRPTFEHRLRQAALRGFMLDTPAAMPGFRISQVSDGPAGQSVQQKPEHGAPFALPEGHVLKGISTLVNADGETIVEWRKTKAGEIDPLAIAAALRDSFQDYAPAALPAPLPESADVDKLTLIPINDLHMGMFAWGKEVGVNWDIKIAEDVIGRSVEDVIARSSASDECILLGGGDLAHVDNKRNETTSGTPQDADGRYPKIVNAVTRLMVRITDASLRRHKHVTLRILPGNHDEHTSVAIAYFLLAWYRNEPRVTVDVDPSLFFWFRFGKVMIGATHGHTVKLAAMPGIMAHRRAEDWGATKFRYVHGFHIHHTSKVATEGNGVVCESHQAPIPQDAWHFGSGYMSGRSISAITYHREFGETGRVREVILDATPTVKDAA